MARNLVLAAFTFFFCISMCNTRRLTSHNRLLKEYKYDEEKAKELLTLYRIARCDAEQVREWDCGPCEESKLNPFGEIEQYRSSQLAAPIKIIRPDGKDYMNGFVAVIGHDAGHTQCVAAFRSADKKMNKLSEYMSVSQDATRSSQLPWCKGCELNSAFLKAYLVVKKSFVEAILALHCQDVQITGKGFDAGVATIAVADLHASDELKKAGIQFPPAYLFGTPPVGNQAFKAAFAAVVDSDRPGVWRINSRYETRVVAAASGGWIRKSTDYVHVGAEVFYATSPMQDGQYQVCYWRNGASDTNCSQSVTKDEIKAAANSTDGSVYFGLDWVSEEMLPINDCPSESEESDANGLPDLSGSSSNFGKLTLNGHNSPSPLVTYNESTAKFFMQLAQVSFCVGDRLERWDCGAPCEDAGYNPNDVEVTPGKTQWTQRKSVHKKAVVYLQEGEWHRVHGYVALLPPYAPQLPPAEISSKTGYQRIRCVVAFRGSSNAKNWVTDAMVGLTRLYGHQTYGLDNCRKCKAHSGFLGAYGELQSQMHSAIHDLACEEVFVTGHSLGGGVATLAVMDLRASHAVRKLGIIVRPAWLFASPAAGNNAFRRAFYQLAQAAEQPAAWRVSSKFDAVPRLHEPYNKLRSGSAKYLHVGTHVFYNTDPMTQGQYVVCPVSDDENCTGTVGSKMLAKNQKGSNHVMYLNVDLRHLPQTECMGKTSTQDLADKVVITHEDQAVEVTQGAKNTKIKRRTIVQPRPSGDQLSDVLTSLYPMTPLERMRSMELLGDDDY